MKLRTLTPFLLILVCASCGEGGLPPGASAAPPPISISVSPLTAVVATGGQQQFNATVQGGGSGQQGFFWSVASGSGTISSSGLYTAPAFMPGSPTAKVRATSAVDSSKFAEATVTIILGPQPGQFPVFFDVKTRNAWQAQVAPATVGIPLPPGLHANEGTLRVQAEVGQTNVPAQFEVLSRWNDGSIRWVLCDFLADLSAGTGIGRYRLTDGGTGTAPTANLTVTDGAAAISVSTGTLSFSVSKTAFRLFESVMIDRDNDAVVDDECLNLAASRGVAVVEGVDEYTMNNSTPTRIAVEQSGPIRATIVVEGEHRTAASAKKLDFVCRITAWNNLPYIKVQYSFKNMQGHGVAAATPSAAAAQLAAYETADALNFNVPLDFGVTTPAALIGGSPTHTTIPAMSGAEFGELFQTYTGTHDAADAENPQPPGFNAGTGDGSSDPLVNTWPNQGTTEITSTISGKVTDTGERAPGWVQFAGSNLRLTAAIRDFWQMYPKAIRVQGDGLLQLGLWPDAAWQMQVFAGSMRTHEMLFAFERSSTLDGNGAAIRANLVNDPPVGVCRPAHYRASLVFGDIGITDETLTDTSLYVNAAQGLAASYFGEVVAHLGDLLADRSNGNGTATGHQYGFWNWGDSRTDIPNLGWENSDWELPRACLGWFAMTGNLGFFAMADDTVRHFRDVDVLHSNVGLRFDYTEAGNPAVSGGKASQLGKTRYTPNNKQHDLGNYHFGENHLDVFKGAFLAEHYLLTGDRLSLDILKENFTYLRGTWKRFFDASNGGVNSTMTAPTTWLSNGLYIAAAYQMANGLNDPAAATMSAYVLSIVRARQNGTSPRDPSGNGFDDSNGDFFAWQIGHMVEALEYSIYALDDTTIQPDILRAMNWLLGTNAGVYLGNLPTPLFGEFAETPGGTIDFGAPNLMIGAGYAAAYRETGSNNWRTSGQNLLSAQLPNIDFVTIGDDEVRHSTFAQFFRAGPMLLGMLMQ